MPESIVDAVQEAAAAHGQWDQLSLRRAQTLCEVAVLDYGSFCRRFPLIRPAATVPRAGFVVLGP